MPEDFSRFGSGGATNITPEALFLVATAIVLLFVLPRKYVIVPFLIIAIFIPFSQVLVIGGLHFGMIRIVILFAWVRMVGSKLMGSRQSLRLQMNPLDRVVVLWSIASVISFTLLWGSSGAFINRLGFLYNTVGIYFLFRWLIRDLQDVDRTMKTLVFICFVVAIFMWNEQVTGRNMFAIFGGAPQFTVVREGYRRAQAAFAHEILAGVFGATLLPLGVGLWSNGGRSKKIALIGILSAVAVSIASGASTALIALAAGIAALCFWPLRRQMRLFRWGVVFVLIALHLVMQAPVWALIGRVGIFGGSSGYHRYMLIDQSIRHFGEWWLLGVRDTSKWGWDMWDTSNFYVETAVTGGMVTLIFFVAVIVCSFQSLGRARKAVEGKLAAEWRCWIFGAALCSHAVAFVGVSYFDQTIVSWYALLAMISVVATAPETTSVELGLVAETVNTLPKRLAPVSLKTSSSSSTSPALLISGKERKYEGQ